MGGGIVAQSAATALAMRLSWSLFVLDGYPEPGIRVNFTIVCQVEEIPLCLMQYVQQFSEITIWTL